MAEKLTIEARIAHFLRVSEDAGATPEERRTAGEEAERLLAKHAIDRLTLDAGGGRAASDTIERRTISVTGGRGTVALDVVLGLCKAASALGLVPHYQDFRDPGARYFAPSGRPQVVLTVTGFTTDLDLAVALLQSLATQATLAMWTWWRSDPRHRAIPAYDALLARCDFARSFGAGAAERLRVTRTDTIASTGTDLVVASRERAIREWVAEHVSARGQTDRRGFSGYGRGEGFAAGLKSSGSAQRALPSSRS